MNIHRFITTIAAGSLLLAAGVFAVPSADDLADARAAFDAFHRISEQDNGAFWDVPLYGPMLLVNPDDRTVIANEPDANGQLKKIDGVYIGQLPPEVGIANTAVDWSGTRWSMVRLPLPRDEKARNSLIIHESFHRFQPDIGIDLATPDNNHLDKTDGRIFLRLELAALRDAVNADPDAVREHLADALRFRAYRRSLFPGSDSTETAMERTEGLAEFTGQSFSGRTRAETIHHLNISLDRFLAADTYIRAFAYETGPLYGFLLSEREPGWQRTLRPGEGLAGAARRVFGLSSTEDSKTTIDSLAARYDFATIRTEELARAETKQRRAELLMDRFGKSPVLYLPNQNMNIQFDGKSLYPVEGVGTYYVPLTAVADWGHLEADSGGVVSPDWMRLIVTAPTEFRVSGASGVGWTLTLNDTWYIAASPDSTRFAVLKHE